MEETVRIQKWLSHLGIASRREAERWLEAGLISVNGKVVTEMGMRIDPESDQVMVKGKLVENKAPPRVYWLLNKPDKVLTTRSDDRERETIYDLPKLKKISYLVSPVGRLDYRTEGLLLMTNDGELANRLCHPKYKVPRQYYALANRRLTEEELKQIREGIKLEDGMTQKIKITFDNGMKMGASKGAWYDVTVNEGRNRLVRRLFEHFDVKVVKLLRYAFGDIFIPPALAPGDYQQLTPEQIAQLKASAGLKNLGLMGRLEMLKSIVVKIFMAQIFLADGALAEEFLGIESNGINVEQNDPVSIEHLEAQPPASENAESNQSVSSKPSPSYRKWNMMMSGGSPGKDRVGADASISMKTSPWTSWRLTGNYIRYKSSEELELAYGGALYYVLRFENKTMIKPSAGAGPGYQKWKREKREILFNDDKSVTLNAFWGAALMFTDHFGLNIQRNMMRYLEEGPVLFEDSEKSENKTAINTSIGFLAYF